MYMGFTLGSAHTQVAIRHALFIHGRCQPMSQATVNNRQATVCDAPCLRLTCGQFHPGVRRLLRDPIAGWGPNNPPHTTPSCPWSRPAESTALQHGGRTVRSLAPLHTCEQVLLAPAASTNPSPCARPKTEIKGYAKGGGAGQKDQAVLALSQNGVRHVST